MKSLLDRALRLENCRGGASNILMEDANVACIFDLVKEKLGAQVSTGNAASLQLQSIKVSPYPNLVHLVCFASTWGKKQAVPLLCY